MELPQLKEIEDNGIKEYAEMANFYENNHITRIFYTPSSQFVVDSR